MASFRAICRRQVAKNSIMIKVFGATLRRLSRLRENCHSRDIPTTTPTSFPGFSPTRPYGAEREPGNEVATTPPPPKLPILLPQLPLYFSLVKITTRTPYHKRILKLH